jgi:hypothetical protein
MLRSPGNLTGSGLVFLFFIFFTGLLIDLVPTYIKNNETEAVRRAAVVVTGTLARFIGPWQG